MKQNSRLETIKGVCTCPAEDSDETVSEVIMCGSDDDDDDDMTRVRMADGEREHQTV